jgi:hypothetical protein
MIFHQETWNYSEFLKIPAAPSVSHQHIFVFWENFSLNLLLFFGALSWSFKN